MQGQASTRLGFTDYFRVELAWAKLLGAVLSLAPVPARLKEWVYAALPNSPSACFDLLSRVAISTVRTKPGRLGVRSTRRAPRLAMNTDAGAERQRARTS